MGRNMLISNLKFTLSFISDKDLKIEQIYRELNTEWIVHVCVCGERLYINCQSCEGPVRHIQRLL